MGYFDTLVSTTGPNWKWPFELLMPLTLPPIDHCVRYHQETENEADDN